MSAKEITNTDAIYIKVWILAENAKFADIYVPKVKLSL